MKFMPERNFNRLMSALLAGMILVAPLNARGQQFQSAAERELYQQYYKAVQKDKDQVKGCALAQEFLTKFPQSQYAKYARSTLEKCQLDKFQNALNEYYRAPDATKLEALIAAGEQSLKEQPGQMYVTVQLALAMSRGAISGNYQDPDKAGSYAEQALKLIESPAPPEHWQADQYTELRNAALAQLNQFLAWRELRRENASPEQVIAAVNRAIDVKGKDNLGWKDPNNYWLRAGAYTNQYQKLKAQYDALPAEEKTGEAGKALLAQVDALVDKMIEDYARVVALATQPQTQPLQQSAREQLEQFREYRHNGKTDGVAQYIKAFENDPSVRPPKPTGK
jgi:hypothetical protein